MITFGLVLALWCAVSVALAFFVAAVIGWADSAPRPYPVHRAPGPAKVNIPPHIMARIPRQRVKPVPTAEFRWFG